MTTASGAHPVEAGGSGRLRVLIVDDEPLARRRLRALLSTHDDVAIVGEAEDARRRAGGARALTGRSGVPGPQ